MACRSAFVYSPDYLGYKLSASHPLNPIRLALTDSLVESAGLLADPLVARVEPRVASEDELLLAHDRAYVERVKEIGRSGRRADPYQDFGLGSSDNPPFRGMHEATSLVVGGTLRACELVMSGQVLHAFNPGGGLHHANRSLASGFCIYNDAAVGVAWLRRQGARVLYVDTDAHHGDGVQWIFYDDPDVLTISLHESGRYLFPGTGEPSERGEGAGFGYAVNVPLQPYTDHESYVECYDRVVPALARAFKPDVIVAQNGCDGHILDPLTHLAYQTPTFEHVAKRTHELAHELCDGRLVALGGGGYSLWDAVPRAWALVWAAVSGQELPDAVPDGWRDRWSAESPEPLPTAMRGLVGSRIRQADVAAANFSVAAEVAARGLPQMGRF